MSSIYAKIDYIYKREKYRTLHLFVGSVMFEFEFGKSRNFKLHSKANALKKKTLESDESVENASCVREQKAQAPENIHQSNGRKRKQFHRIINDLLTNVFKMKSYEN